MQRSYSYLAVIALMMGLAQAANANPARPNVLVMGAPITPYIAAIVGKAGTTQNLMQSNQDMHQFALAPSQMELIEKADILVIPDISINPMLAGVIKQHPKIKLIELSLLDGTEPLAYRTDNPWVDNGAKKKTEIKEEPANPRFPRKLAGFDQIPTEPPAPADKDMLVDPHFWLDPERMAAIAMPLAKEFSTYSLANRATFEANAGEMATHLRRDVLPNLKQMLGNRRVAPASAGKAELAFIVAHPSYQYFIERFNLPYHGQITSRPEEYLGGATLDRLYSAAKDTRIHCVIAEAPTSYVQRIAQLSGAKIVISRPEQEDDAKAVAPRDWLKNDYDRMLYSVAQKFQGCI